MIAIVNILFISLIIRTKLLEFIKYHYLMIDYLLNNPSRCEYKFKNKMNEIQFNLNKINKDHRQLKFYHIIHSLIFNKTRLIHEL